VSKINVSKAKILSVDIWGGGGGETCFFILKEKNTN
jgi:hypothetical protein